MTRHARASTRTTRLGLALSVVVLAAGCHSGSASGGTTSDGVTAAQLEDYVAQVEPVRLGVNELLDGADPILEAYRAKEITPEEASRRFGELEAAFAAQLTAIEAIAPPQAALEAIHRPYADTYLQEDTYLSALAAALPSGEFDDLPNTQNDQRRTIIEWRTHLEVLAGRTGASLPGDLQQAGRGEIAPSPTES